MNRIDTRLTNSVGKQITLSYATGSGFASDHGILASHDDETITISWNGRLRTYFRAAILWIELDDGAA